jgi:hypothetical protein
VTIVKQCGRSWYQTLLLFLVSLGAGITFLWIGNSQLYHVPQDGAHIAVPSVFIPDFPTHVTDVKPFAAQHHQQYLGSVYTTNTTLSLPTQSFTTITTRLDTTVETVSPFASTNVDTHGSNQTKKTPKIRLAFWFFADSMASLLTGYGTMNLHEMLIDRRMWTCAALSSLLHAAPQSINVFALVLRASHTNDDILATSLIDAAKDDFLGGILVRVLTIPGLAVAITAAGGTDQPWSSYREVHMATEFDSNHLLMSYAMLAGTGIFLHAAENLFHNTTTTTVVAARPGVISPTTPLRLQRAARASMIVIASMFATLSDRHVFDQS